MKAIALKKKKKKKEFVSRHLVLKSKAVTDLSFRNSRIYNPKLGAYKTCLQHSGTSTQNISELIKKLLIHYDIIVCAIILHIIHYIIGYYA